MSWFCNHRVCIFLRGRAGTETACAGCRRVEILSYGRVSSEHPVEQHNMRSSKDLQVRLEAVTNHAGGGWQMGKPSLNTVDRLSTRSAQRDTQRAVKDSSILCMYIIDNSFLESTRKKTKTTCALSRGQNKQQTIMVTTLDE